MYYFPLRTGVPSIIPDAVKTPGEKGVKTLYHVGNSA
jgi:hypothetical protein